MKLNSISVSFVDPSARPGLANIVQLTESHAFTVHDVHSLAWLLPSGRRVRS